VANKNSKALKQAAAESALRFVPPGSVIGVGSGSTIEFFIAALAHRRELISGAVATSKASAELLTSAGIPICDPNFIEQLPVCVDGADEINLELEMIKGGGGALTREKIVAAMSRIFVCVADESKLVARLGRFPLAIEVIPMAAGYVGHELARHGGRPLLREGFLTDNGNVILDVHELPISNPVDLEGEINQIAGVVTCGIFARRHADVLLLSRPSGVEEHRR